MGTITISVDDEIEHRFRKSAKEEYGTGKGTLGKAVAEALDAWAKEKEQKEIAERQIALMNKGFSLGKWKFDRGALHERGN
ncbi:hypothetical protein HYU19_01680 [Candidatus Woesearchaeota archaeon]|nr:hypothetical protein [Candidatus Woesearchaeota archaeon]